MVNNTMTSRQKLPVHLMEKLSETAPEGDNGGASPPPPGRSNCFWPMWLSTWTPLLALSKGDQKNKDRLHYACFFIALLFRTNNPLEVAR